MMVSLTINLPALRSRREDIPDLVDYLLAKHARTLGKHVSGASHAAMQILRSDRWKGNVRELENFIERSVILTEGTALRAPLADLQAESPGSGAAEHSLEGAEREHIIRVLRETRGMISGPTGAARRLGLKRTTLQSKMQRLGITRQEYASRETD